MRKDEYGKEYSRQRTACMMTQRQEKAWFVWGNKVSVRVLCIKCCWWRWQEEVGGDEFFDKVDHIFLHRSLNRKFEFYFKCTRKPFKVFISCNPLYLLKNHSGCYMENGLGGKQVQNVERWWYKEIDAFEIYYEVRMTRFRDGMDKSWGEKETGMKDDSQVSSLDKNNKKD